MAINRVGGTTRAEINAHTEQALVELVYVREANDLIGSALGNLDSALNASRSVLNILQALQNLHNSLSVRSVGTLPFDFKTGLARGVILPTLGATAYVGSYNTIASAYFGKAIDPFFVFSGPNDPAFITFSRSLRTLRNNLIAEIRVISAITPADAKGAGSLLASLKAVLNDLPANPLDFAAAERWALDNLNQNPGAANPAGTQTLGNDIQNDLTTAITAAQSLNDTQKEQVRKFLFIFQEYYQSASAILSGINKIVEMMAQKISS